MIAQFEDAAIVALDAEELPQLLELADVIREDDTCISGWIRILRINGSYAVQEQTPGGEILVRMLVSRKAAEHFIEDRLTVYERMWDGCGCKVDYHN